MLPPECTVRSQSLQTQKQKTALCAVSLNIESIAKQYFQQKWGFSRPKTLYSGISNSAELKRQ
ncbi:hypothetical protein APA_685 [Pseudanabaena sp. lw0831]|nr:hypothetical protein APA_685 [Pseudanabaena sp. lw0831]